MELGIPLIIAAVVLFVVGIVLQRRRPTPSPAEPSGGRPPVEPDFVQPRPPVTEFHVLGEEARVTFDVPIPDEPDPVLGELLTHEAVEVVREKRHSLPIEGVRVVVALAGRTTPIEVGRVELETPGELPPRPRVPSLLNLTHIAADPLEAELEEELPRVPDTRTTIPEDVLSPIGGELRLPKAVETGLRAQGIDPSTMTAGDLVTGLLPLVGYVVSPGAAENTFYAEKGGQRTFIRVEGYRPGDHPEVDSETIQRFMIEFETSGAQRGLLVSDKFGPFEVYQRERREPRVRFVTRERLQKLIDALALG